MSLEVAMKGLDAWQRGHIRHFDNLSRQFANDWSLMNGRGVGQDDFGGYRFQLAYMMYALALTHIHRLPAAPGLVKPIFERLFGKLLLPEVWMYWARVSRGGAVFNQSLGALQEEWNPIAHDNIHYKAYVHSLSLLFNYLFDDARYAAPGSILFKYFSFFWGGEPKVFRCDQNSLNDHLYWEMVASGYLGIACEPNTIFQICNQPAILGFRLHDLLNGGSRAAEVTQAYEAAWREFGRIGENGHYMQMIVKDAHRAQPNEGKAPWIDAWCGLLLNMWQRDFVRVHYPSQVAELVAPGPDGTLFTRPSSWPEAFGEKVEADDCDFGWVTAWASEMGDTERLTGLLAHADRFMRPTWHRGGLYYPRNDVPEDDRGNRTLMDPQTGNVLLGFARLNVPDGLWTLYNEPLDRSFHRNPALVEVAEDVEVYRAVFDGRALHFTLALHPGIRCTGDVVVGRIAQRGAWTLRCDGREIARGVGSRVETASPGGTVSTGEGIRVPCPPNGVHAFEVQFA